MRTFLLLVFTLCNLLLFGQQIEAELPSGTYYPGQPIEFRISGFSGTVNYEYGYAAKPYNWAGNMEILPSPTSGSVVISNSGTITIPAPLLSEQVSVICRLVANNDYAVAIYNPVAAQAHYPEPSDFGTFWNNQYAAANAVANQFTLTNEITQGAHKRYTFTIRTIASNYILAGYIFVPLSAGPHPMMMRHFPAGGTASPTLYGNTPDNLIVVHCNFYNTTDPTSSSNPVEGGTMDQNTFDLRHVILGSIKLIDYFYSTNLDTRITFNQQDFGIFGNSRGGGMSMIVAGLDHLLADLNSGRNKATKVISVSAPAFAGQSNASTRLTGYPHWVNFGSSSNSASAYYDAIHFSNYYTNTAFMETNYLDDVCPAETNLAALNRLRGKAILSSNPIVGHSHHGAFWNYSIAEFLKRYLTPNLNVSSGLSGYAVDAGGDISTDINVLEELDAKVWKESNIITSSLGNIRWEVVEPAGSNQVEFPNGSNQADADVRFTANGNYVLRFSGTIDRDGTYEGGGQTPGFYTFIDYVEVSVGGGGSCSLSATNASVNCNDQGTSTESDDTFSLTVNPSGTNTGSQYRVWIDGVDKGTFNYGSTSNIAGEYLISQGSVDLEVEDVSNTACLINQTISPPSPCSTNGCSGGSTVTDCNVTVDVSGQTISFVSTSETDILIIKVRKADWSEQYDLCNDYNPATACGPSSSVTVTGTGTYVVDIQGGTSCSTFNITVPGGGGGGTDNDNDGICSDEDCDDNDAAVGASQPVGTACDDGDSSTTDDEIQADGCTCLGTPTGCGSFTDNDNDGICSNEDCDDNNASVGASQPQYTPCDDGNANTSYDMIQADGCTCLGVNCGGGGSTVSGCNVTVDVSGQTVSFVSTSETDILIIKIRKADWSEQYDLCNDYNPATACSPSSSVTVTGTGTYVVDIQGGTSCSTFNITVPGGGGSGTDNDNDSVCDVIDCDDSDASIGAPQPAGTSCDDGDSSTTDDEIQADGCTCLGTPIGCGSFTDNDNDGICSNEDCDDNNASVGASQPQYTPCDDGNSNTDFDMIQADGCTCLGVSCGGGGSTVSGCNVTVDVSGQTVSFVSTSETDILIIKVRKADWSEQYDLCNDYNPATACSPSSSVTVTGTGTYVVDIQGGTSCSTFNITVPGGGGSGTDNDNDSVCDVIDCDDSDASVGVPQPAGTVCDDGNPSTTNDEIQADGCTCLGSNNLTVNTDTELEQGRLSVFPNPTSGVVQLLVPHSNSIHQVEVYNINGERILQLREQPTRVDLSAQPNGVYWLRVSTEKGVSNRRIIKQ